MKVYILMIQEMSGQSIFGVYATAELRDRVLREAQENWDRPGKKYGRIHPNDFNQYDEDVVTE